MPGSAKAETLVIISFYDRREAQNLERLLEGLRTIPAGQPFDTLVVVNSTGDTRIDEVVGDQAKVIYRENTGMNIGAWDHGWRTHSNYKSYVFLQDECSVSSPNWLVHIQKALGYSEIGLLGESINAAWDRSWETLEIAHKGAQLPDHFIEGKKADRLPAYLHAFKTWGIDRGRDGRHIRSLIWAMRSETLRRIDGFPIGRNYGECIAAEIAVSKAVESLGLKVAQIAAQEFFCFRHWEWNSNYAGHPALHKARPSRQMVGLKRQELDTEAINAWKAVVELERSNPTIDQEIALASLAAKLKDREEEIVRLRNLLCKN
ncbi:MAG: hypothetical protein AAF437_03715 [Pseudomonadota bacterium]